MQIGTSSIWQALVSTEKNVEIPQNVGKYLTGSKSISVFQDELQFCGVRRLLKPSRQMLK